MADDKPELQVNTVSISRVGLPRIYYAKSLREGKRYLLCPYLDERTRSGKPKTAVTGQVIAIKDIAEDGMLTYALDAGGWARANFLDLRSAYGIYGPLGESVMAIQTKRKAAIDLLRQAVVLLESCE